MRYVIGLDVGGTTMKAAVLDETGCIHARGSRETKVLGQPDVVLERIIDLIDELRASSPQPVEAVGITIPGPFDPKRGISVHSPNLGWKQLDVRTPLANAIDLPLVLENDLRTATIGEAVFGAGKGVRDLVFAPLGTGFGAGIISDGKPLLGAHGFSGEIGHVPYPGNPALCNCGRIGCVETVASATGIARLARETLVEQLVANGEAVRSSILYRLVEGELAAITAQLVAEAAQQGDEVARQAWAYMCEVLGWSLAVLINLFGPEKVILGGGVSNARDQLLLPVRQAVKRYTMDALYEKVEVEIAALGADAGILGAGALALGANNSAQFT